MRAAAVRERDRPGPTTPTSPWAQVDDPDFWKDAVELSFGALPRLQQEVFVAGYPVGGETLSLTGGVVSRLDFDSYAHSTRQHLVCGVDAAINPGNSGGPVFSGDRVVGIAFQSLMGAEVRVVSAHAATHVP
jgi:S1-C subfamily serine protease